MRITDLCDGLAFGTDRETFRFAARASTKSAKGSAEVFIVLTFPFSSTPTCTGSPQRCLGSIVLKKSGVPVFSQHRLQPHAGRSPGPANESPLSFPTSEIHLALAILSKPAHLLAVSHQRPDGPRSGITQGDNIKKAQVRGYAWRSGPHGGAKKLAGEKNLKGFDIQQEWRMIRGVGSALEPYERRFS